MSEFLRTLREVFCWHRWEKESERRLTASGFFTQASGDYLDGILKTEWRCSKCRKWTVTTEHSPAPLRLGDPSARTRDWKPYKPPRMGGWAT